MFPLTEIRNLCLKEIFIGFTFFFFYLLFQVSILVKTEPLNIVMFFKNTDSWLAYLHQVFNSNTYLTAKKAQGTRLLFHLGC